MKKLLFLLSVCSVIFVLLLLNTKSYASPEFDNYTWQRLPDYITGRNLYAVASNGTNFVAVGEKGTVLTSDNGKIWSRRQLGYEENLYQVLWDGQKYIITSESGKQFISDKWLYWSLSSEKGQPITTVSAISFNGMNPIFKGKLFGLATQNSKAVSVGESGNIFYGIEKGQTPEKLEGLVLRDYERDYLKRLGNSTLLYIGSSKMYSDNSVFKANIPAPYSQTVNKEEIIYVPAEHAAAAIGGNYKYDSAKTSGEVSVNGKTIQFTINKNSILVNGKSTTVINSAVVKSNVVYLPLKTFELLGMKAYKNGNLVLISNISDVLRDSDEEIIQALNLLFKDSKLQGQSLSESVVKSLIQLGKQQVEKSEFDTAKAYFNEANEVEPYSDTFSYLVSIQRQNEEFNEARKYAAKGLDQNCENPKLLTELVYLYTDLHWPDRAAECLEKAIAISPKGTDFSGPTKYLNNIKGKEETIKEVTVSGYKQLINALASNRKIKLLPGNYNFDSSYSASLAGLNNVTIIGTPGSGKKYIDLISNLEIFNCCNITISNINVDGSINIENCSKVLLNNCKNNNGLIVKCVYNLTCDNSYLENKGSANYEGFIVEVLASEKLTFNNSTLKGYTLQIEEYEYGTENKDITLNNCSLINDAGICSTFSNYVPIKDDSGYEVFFGTEGWSEWRFLAAIKYIHNPDYKLTYNNTYDGNEAIYKDGKFLKLADKLKALDGKTFPSIDYIPGDNDNWNAYYDYYGTPKLKKLNINLTIDDINIATFSKMYEMIKTLKPVEKDILAYNWPVSIILRDKDHRIVAIADFSNKSFKEFLTLGSAGTMHNYCTVMINDRTYSYKPYFMQTNAEKFFEISVKAKENDIFKYIEKAFLTKTLNVSPNSDYGQINSVEFAIKNKDGVFYLSSIESFIGVGDFMHYSTELIVRTNAVTGEQMILGKNYAYKVLDSKATKAYDKYKAAINNQLLKNKDVIRKINGTPCKDVFVYVEDKSKKDKISFIFLAAKKTGDGEPEYSFTYYLGTFDTKSSKVVEVKPVGLVDYSMILYK